MKCSACHEGITDPGELVTAEFRVLLPGGIAVTVVRTHMHDDCVPPAMADVIAGRLATGDITYVEAGT